MLFYSILLCLGGNRRLVAAAGVVAAVAFAAATATVFAATVVVTTATAAVSGLKLFGGSVAHGLHLTLEADIFACEGMVEVHNYLFLFYFLDETVDAETVGGHHGHEGADFHHIGVKLAVDDEKVFVKCDNLLGVVGTECLVGLYGNIVCATDFQTVESYLKRLYHAAGHSEDKLLGVSGIYLMNELFGAVGIYLIQVVSDFDIFAGFDFFHNYICFKLIFNNIRYKLIFGLSGDSHACRLYIQQKLCQKVTVTELRRT